MKSALYNNNNVTIEEAAHHVITTWLKGQKSQEKAYSDLLSALKESDMNKKAAEMTQLMEETTQTTGVMGETSAQFTVINNLSNFESFHDLYSHTCNFSG